MDNTLLTINKPLCSKCGKREIIRQELCESCYVMAGNYRRHLNSPMIPCGCGCGEMIHSIHIDGRKARYKNHHGCRGKKHPIYGENHPNWKGGFTKRGDYTYYICKGHPNADSDGYVALHRLMMEIYLDRYLESWEYVHHIIPLKEGGTNNIENLELTTVREHPTKHRKDMSDRVCSSCGRDWSYKMRNYEVWFDDHKGGFECSRCHQTTYKGYKSKRLDK